MTTVNNIKILEQHLDDLGIPQIYNYNDFTNIIDDILNMDSKNVKDNPKEKKVKRKYTRKVNKDKPATHKVKDNSIKKTNKVKDNSIIKKKNKEFARKKRKRKAEEYEILKEKYIVL